MNYTALVVAAGSGSRLGLGYNKMLYKLNSGKTILETTVSIFMNDRRCSQIVVVASKDDMHTYAQLFSCGKVVFVLGGKTRAESVCHGLNAVKEDVVLIHDGARPWLDMKCVDEILKTMETEKACMLAVPSKDTVKRVENGYVKETVIRDEVYNAQTPQAFITDEIIEAYRCAKTENFTGTDDASVMERFGTSKIKIVKGSYENIKVTTKEDIIGK